MADAKTNAAWREAKRQILLALNLPAEFEALGLRLAGGGRRNSKGWIYVHSFQEDDKGPSAGINVVDGPLLGYYKDFRDAAKNCGFFDFCIRARGGTYSEVLKHFAVKANVKLPNGDEERTVDRLEFRAAHYSQSHLGFGEKQQYAQGKRGVTMAALEAVGCLAAAWPKGLSAERQNQLLVVPMYGSSLLHEHEPTGWHCAAVHPLRKIRKFAGKGNEEQLLKTMTIGEFGLMGLDGLKRLEDATVVNLVEGLTDLLAAQAALLTARELDPQYEKHVVLSTGGSTYHLQPQWLQHFAGKDVRVWGDVGDKDGAGDKGAARQCTILLPVAGAVRNVKLPLGKSSDGNGDGKNDVRAWLTEPEAKRGYAQMDEYARTFTPIEPGDESAQLSAHDAILQSLGLVVLGEYERSQRIEVYCEATKKSSTINDVNKLTVPTLVQLLGPDPIDEHVHDGNEPQPGKYQIKDVRKAIAAAASSKLYFGEHKHGAGAWSIENKLYLVKAREVGIINGAKIETSTMPFVGGHILDIAQSCGEWYQADTLGRYLLEAQRAEWCQDVFEEADRLLRNWYWREKPGPQVATALIIASWLQTTWNWRPQIFFTGESNTGKSMLLGETIAPMFGPLGMYCVKPSAAGISQAMMHHGRVVIIDEFEKDNHRQQIFEMFRMSSQKSGGRKYRGSVSHEAVSFVLRHIPWFAAINIGMQKQPDRNRFILFNMNELPKGQHGKARIPTLAKLRDLGQRLLAVGIAKWQLASDLMDELKTLSVDGIPGRVIENFSLPAAIFASVFGCSRVMAEDVLQGWLAEWDFTGQTVRDHVEVLQEVLTGEVMMEGGRRTTVSRLLADAPSPDVTETLARIGIRKVHKRGPLGKTVLFFCTSVLQRALMKPGSEFQGDALDQYLLRFNGAARSRQRLGGEERFWGVGIPMETISEIFESGKDSETESSESGEEGDSGPATGF